MAESREKLADLISDLKQQRDELALKIHLGKVEAQAEWDRLTARLEKLAEDYEPVKDAAQESATNVRDSLRLVAGEIRSGFDRIRKTL